MNHLSMSLFLAGTLAVTSCTSLPTRFTDGSTSRLTQEQATDIAKRAVAANESWPDEPRIENKPSRLVLYSPERTNRGGWRVIARPSRSENGPDAGSGAMFEPVPSAVIRISATGEVTGYSHISYDASCREFARR